MPNTKMRNYITALFLFFYVLFFASASYAQTPPPIPSLPQIQTNPDDPTSTIGAQFDSNAIGVTCGIPESLNRSEGTRCCNTNLNSTELLQEPLNRAPKFFCLGGALSKGAGIISGIIGAVGDVVSSPFKAISNLAKGHFSDAFGNLLNIGANVATGGSYGIIKGTLEGIKTDDLCLSDAAKLMYIGALPSNPLLHINTQLPTAPQPCMEGAEPTTSDYASASCKCVPAKEDANGVKRLCSLYMSGSRDLQICQSCASGGGYWTGIGCMKTDIAGFAGSIIGVGMGVGGAATFLCIIYAAFILQTSRGNPEKIKKAQENLRACISGLLLIIFSIFILRLIGVTILQIPGLG